MQASSQGLGLGWPSYLDRFLLRMQFIRDYMLAQAWPNIVDGSLSEFSGLLHMTFNVGTAPVSLQQLISKAFGCTTQQTNQSSRHPDHFPACAIQLDFLSVFFYVWRFSCESAASLSSLECVKPDWRCREMLIRIANVPFESVGSATLLHASCRTS